MDMFIQIKSQKAASFFYWTKKNDLESNDSLNVTWIILNPGDGLFFFFPPIL